MDKNNPDNQIAKLEQQLRLLVEAGHSLNQDLSLPTICQNLVIYGMQLVDATAGTVGMLVDGKMQFSSYYHDGSWHPIDYSFEPG